MKTIDKILNLQQAVELIAHNIAKAEEIVKAKLEYLSNHIKPVTIEEILSERGYF